jgi:hypothetical protein
MSSKRVKRPLVFANQLRLETAGAIARHLDRHGPSSVSTVLPLVPLR